MPVNWLSNFDNVIIEIKYMYIYQLKIALIIIYFGLRW